MTKFDALTDTIAWRWNRSIAVFVSEHSTQLSGRILPICVNIMGVGIVMITGLKLTCPLNPGGTNGMAIYFVRHGMDEEGFRGGWSQRGLIVEGYRQSEKLGCYLKEKQSIFQIHRIVSSDLQRALDTANEIARFLNLPVESNNHWRETNNGVIAGMPNEIVNERFPGLYFSSLRMDERYPGGESPLEFYKRIEETFNLLCEEQSSKNHLENVIIVTHGGVINVVYHIVKSIEWTNKNKSFPASNTGIHKVEYCNGQLVLTLENFLEHI